MARRMFEKYRIAVPMAPTSITNSNVTGTYVDVRRLYRLTAILGCGAMAANKTTKLELMQAKDEDAGSAEAIATYTATITANTKVKQATVALASVDTGDTVTVTTYQGTTQIDTATFTKGDADAGLGFTNAAGLEAAINANITGVLAADSTTNVIVTALDGYTVTVASTDAVGSVTVATNEGIVAIDIPEDAIDFDEGFTHIAPKVTSTANGYNSVTFIMEMKDGPTNQYNIGARYPTT